ncbi:hypothetical protein QKT49_gp090 [Acanthamoeba castellanii medusavirus]|uniref:Uncharacterized protein n=1 Tax=Acanthamoeba castellanii medusavirus J1 TaxID=3114988 RepID=A0A3T1CWL5_9VIRU|nr:hypothetical protein QKT49_gp090 [Acanthamoeba castellanii medusavirus]BBI30230.1 hypothetical protein [Acanthamoeba castellanii medusavirus J1]
MRKRSSSNPYARQFPAHSRRRRSSALEETVRKHLRRKLLAGETTNLDELRRELGIGYKLAQRCFEEEAAKAEEHIFDSFVERARSFWERNGGTYHALASAVGPSDRRLALSLVRVMPPVGDPRAVERDASGRTPRDVAFSAEMAHALQGLEPMPPSLPEGTPWLEHVQRFAALVYRCPLPEQSRWTIKPAERTHRATGEKRLCFELTHTADGSRVPLSRAVEYLARLIDGASLAGIPAPHPEIAFLATWLNSVRQVVAEGGQHVLTGIKPSIARHLVPPPSCSLASSAPPPPPKPRRPRPAPTRNRERDWWLRYSVRPKGQQISPGTLMTPTGFASPATCERPTACIGGSKNTPPSP